MSTDQAKSQLPPLRYSMARERRFESSSRKSRPSGAHRIISIQKNKDHKDVLSNLYQFFVLIHCLKVTHKNLSRDPVKHATAPAPVDSLHHGWDADNLSRYSRPIWSSQDNTSQKQRIFQVKQTVSISVGAYNHYFWLPFFFTGGIVPVPSRARRAAARIVRGLRTRTAI